MKEDRVAFEFVFGNWPGTGSKLATTQIKTYTPLLHGKCES